MDIEREDRERKRDIGEGEREKWYSLLLPSNQQPSKLILMYTKIQKMGPSEI